MKKKNVFFIKKIVDKEFMDETRRVNTDEIVKETEKELQKLSDKDFVEVMISCFIPDTYKDQGKKEKLYTKLAELMVGEWWRRMGGEYNLPKKKAGTEDVELKYQKTSIVCDAKIFRLGRSQKAPNVKDFLKLASVQTWINNLKLRYKGKQNVIGGLVTYSSLHEWEEDSEVYLECSNLSTSVLMLPYEVLALLLLMKKEKKFDIKDFIEVWNYKKIGMSTSRSKTDYWNTVNTFLSSLMKLSLNEYNTRINDFRKMIIEASGKYVKLIEEDIKNTKKLIEQEVKGFSDIKVLQEYVIKELDNYRNEHNRAYLERIKKYRKYD